MSVRATAWAWNKRCPTATAKLVLVALADAADMDGLFLTSTQELTEKTHLKWRRLNTLIRLLVESKLVRDNLRSAEDGTLMGVLTLEGGD